MEPSPGGVWGVPQVPIGLALSTFLPYTAGYSVTDLTAINVSSAGKSSDRHTTGSTVTIF